MKTLIAYYSFTGNNEKLVNVLRSLLQCDVLKIEEVKRRTNFGIFLDAFFQRRSRIKEINIKVAAYENVILVAPVWAGKIAGPMQTFILQERNNFTHYAFISLCGGIAGQKEKIASALQELTLIKPDVVEELWVNDLLPVEKKNKIKYTTPYRIKRGRLETICSNVTHFYQKRLRWVPSPSGQRV